MITFHLLTPADRNPNTEGLVFPLKYWRRCLRESGIKVEIFEKVKPQLFECDVLGLDSKRFRHLWKVDFDMCLAEIEFFANQGSRLIWFNTGDGTGQIQRQVLPFVSRYLKSQSLKDRSQYKRIYYGDRVYTDFYHEKYMITDDKEVKSVSLSDKEIQKLSVSWNFGMANFFDYRGNFAYRARKLTSSPQMLIYPQKDRCIKLAKRDRDQFVNFRMRTRYSRKTIAFQRSQLTQFFAKEGYGSNKPIGQRKYFEELRRSRFVVSPFGWGEINLRDFEAVVAGAVLIKPSVDHIETFPNIFSEGETYIPLSWSPEDWEEQIDCIKAQSKFVSVDTAINAIDSYFNHIGEDGRDRFVRRVKRILLESERGESGD